MPYAQLFVSLKISDNIARTAHYSLQNRLGFKSLQSIQRSDFWEMAFPDKSVEEAEEITNDLATKTSFFVNPNKHDFWIQISDEPMSKHGPQPFPVNVDACVLVCDLIDGTAEGTFEAIQGICESERLPQSLKRGVWWDMKFEGVETGAFKDMAEQITLTKSRKEGLLCNPHYQSYQIFCKS